jgi:hypothetical protein
LRPQDQKRNEYQAFHDELPPFFSLLMSEQSTAKSITEGAYCQRIWSSERRPVWVGDTDVEMSAYPSGASIGQRG